MGFLEAAEANTCILDPGFSSLFFIGLSGFSTGLNPNYSSFVYESISHYICLVSLNVCLATSMQAH